MQLEFLIDEEITIKEFIYKKISRNFYGYLKEHDAHYVLNGENKKAYDIANIGSKLIIYYDEEKNVDGILNEGKLDIIYEDEYYIVVDKPSKLQSIPSRGNPNDSIYNRLLFYFKDTPYTIHILNRLDKETKGLMLIAKSNYARAILKSYDKIYVATTDRPLSSVEGIIDLPIKKCDEGIKREVHPEGQRAVTCYKLLSSDNNVFTYEIELITGRTHQIRLHFSHLGSPLINDTLYGGSLISNELGLVCKKLSFYHPMKQDKLEFESKY